MEGCAEEAVRFYTALFSGTIDDVKRFPGPPGDKETVILEFTLDGVSYVAMDAGRGPKLTEAFSFAIACEDQADVDRLWNALVEGGKPSQCGWLTDRFGVTWQIVPKRFFELASSGTPAQSAAVMQAMFGMVKFDIAALEKAFEDAKGS